jgi:hypothetical protein
VYNVILVCPTFRVTFRCVVDTIKILTSLLFCALVISCVSLL